MCGCNKARPGGYGTGGVGSKVVNMRATAPRASVRAPAVRAPVVRAAPVTPSVEDTALWGPPLWKMMHILAHAQDPSASQDSWSALFKALQEEIPCPICRSHAARWFRRTPDFRSIGIQQYLLNLHNDINRRNRVARWTLQQAETTYSAGGKEQQMALIPLLISSVAMMPTVTSVLQAIAASVS